MKHQKSLTITSLIAIVLFTVHYAQDIVLGIEPGDVSTYIGVLITLAWLYPLLVLAGQDAAPDRAGAASGLLFGVTAGVAGLAYPVIGLLQSAWGYAPAIQLTAALLAPASLLAWLAMRRPARA